MHHTEWIDLQVCEKEIHVDAVEVEDELAHSILLFSRQVDEQSLLDGSLSESVIDGHL